MTTVREAPYARRSAAGRLRGAHGAAMKSSLQLTFRVGCGLVVLAALAWQVRTDAAVAALRSLELSTLVGALTIGLATTVLCAWRWCVVAGAIGLTLPIRTAVADYYRAVFLNAVLPAGILGDVHRAVSHGRETGEHGRAARAVVLERVAGQVVLLGSGVVALLALPVSPTDSTARLGVSTVAVLATTLAAVLAVYAAAGRWPWCAKAWSGVRTMLDDARTGLFTRHTGPAVILLSTVAIGGHVALFLLAARIAAPGTSLVTVLPIAVLALVAMSIPLNAAGWGPREAVTVLAFGALGLGAEIGFATAVTYGALAFVAGLPGLGVLFLRRVLAGRSRRPVTPQRVEVGAEGANQVGEGGATLIGGRP